MSNCKLSFILFLILLNIIFLFNILSNTETFSTTTDNHNHHKLDLNNIFGNMVKNTETLNQILIKLETIKDYKLIHHDLDNIKEAIIKLYSVLSLYDGGAVNNANNPSITPQFNNPAITPQFNNPARTTQFNNPARTTQFNNPARTTQFNNPARTTQFNNPARTTQFKPVAAPVNEMSGSSLVTTIAVNTNTNTPGTTIAKIPIPPPSPTTN